MPGSVHIIKYKYQSMKFLRVNKVGQVNPLLPRFHTTKATHLHTFLSISPSRNTSHCPLKFLPILSSAHKDAQTSPWQLTLEFSQDFKWVASKTFPQIHKPQNLSSMTPKSIHHNTWLWEVKYLLTSILFFPLKYRYRRQTLLLQKVYFLQWTSDNRKGKLASHSCPTSISGPRGKKKTKLFHWKYQGSLKQIKRTDAKLNFLIPTI